MLWGSAKDERRISAYAMQPEAETMLAAVAAAESAGWPWQGWWLLAPMSALRGDKAWRYASIATAGSWLGAVAAFLMGYLLWALFGHLGMPRVYADLSRWAESYDVIVWLAAGASPLPFGLFALVGGYLGTSVGQFVVATLIARGARMFFVAWMVWRHGPQAVAWMRRGLYVVSIFAALGLMLTLSLLKYVATYGG